MMGALQPALLLPLTMHQRRLTVYGAIAVATPLLVMANTLLKSGRTHTPVVPLQPLLEKTPRLYPASQSLATAYRAWIMTPYARIVTNSNQRFLEFYIPFTLPEQGPDLSLVLITDAYPANPSARSPSALPLGKMQVRAGKHRYPITVPVSASMSADETLRQYRLVVVWCAELNTTVAYAQLNFEALAAQ